MVEGKVKYIIYNAIIIMQLSYIYKGMRRKNLNKKLAYLVSKYIAKS